MAYPSSPGSRGPTPLLTPAQMEKLQSLIGDRSRGAAGQRAIVHADLANFGKVTFTAAPVTAAPTAAEFNALVEDLRSIAAILNLVGAKITWR